MALNEGRDGMVLTRRERSLARKLTVMPQEVVPVRGRLRLLGNRNESIIKYNYTNRATCGISFLHL